MGGKPPTEITLGITINGESTGSNLTDIDVDRVGTNETTARVGVYLDNTADGVVLSKCEL